MGNALRPILIVDDNPATLYSTSRVLRGAFFEVIEATTGAEALALVARNPGLIVLDVHLPDANGFDLARQFRQIRNTANVPIIHLSAAYISAEHTVAGLEAGADAYLTHPAEPTILVATVRALLRARHAEEAKRKTEAKFRALFEQITNFAMILDLSGTLIEVNRSALVACGYERETCVGIPFWQTPWWRNDENVQGIIQEACEKCLKGTASRIELPFLLQDNSERIMDLHLTPVMDESNDTVYLGAIGSDITDRKAAEEENARLYKSLQDADRKKDEFLATLAHELRNPLAPIRNGTQILRSTVLTDESIRVFDMMERQMAHLVRLVDDLLDVSRITSGKIDLQRQVVPLNTVIEAAVETSAPIIKSSGHTLHVPTLEKEIFVNCDLVRLAQVFSNLLNNASKFTTVGGTISIEVESKEDRVQIRVVDNGIGIPADQLDEIFDSFVQLKDARSQEIGGLGLGLALAKNLAILHGGDVTVQSSEAGTTMCVDLPMASSLAQSADSKVEAPSPMKSFELRVLIIDDNLDNAEMLATLLGLSGHEVRTAANGERGIAEASAFEPHLAFVDIGLPDISGYEVGANLRERFSDGIDLVALTGYGTSADKLRAREAGFDVHLTKPAPTERFIEILTGSVQKRS